MLWLLGHPWKTNVRTEMNPPLSHLYCILNLGPLWKVTVKVFPASDLNKSLLSFTYTHTHTHTLALPNNISFEKQNVTSSIQRPEVPQFWSGEPRQETLLSFCLSPHGQPLVQLTEGRVCSEFPWCTAAGRQQLTFVLWEWSQRGQHQESV